MKKLLLMSIVLCATQVEALTCKVGKTFQVELPATIPGTTWQLSSAPQMVKQVGEPETVNVKQKGMLGGPSKMKIYTFQAVKPGTETIYFTKIGPSGIPVNTDVVSQEVTVK